MLSDLIYSRPDIRVFSSLRSPGRHMVTPATQLLKPRAASRPPVSPTFKHPQDLSISHTFSTGTLVPAATLSLLAPNTASVLILPQSRTHRAARATSSKVKQSASLPAFNPHQLSSQALFSACRVEVCLPQPRTLALVCSALSRPKSTLDSGRLMAPLRASVSPPIKGWAGVS